MKDQLVIRHNRYNVAQPSALVTAPVVLPEKSLNTAFLFSIIDISLNNLLSGLETDS